jgi:beta-glucosidase-like glycosyl hydrolase
MVDLQAIPYSLNKEQIDWVNSIFESMTLDEKIGQLFVHMRESLDPDIIKKTLNTYQQGGLRWQGGDSEAVYSQNKTYQELSKIPLLIAANCDNGGDGCVSDGTFIATAAQAAAVSSSKTAYDIGYTAGREASSVGCNWMFNPCADIFLNWRNTIVNTRAFGDNADQVIENVRAFIQGLHQSNMAACCKHFPGDGVEERDQHLVLGVNDLSVEEWNETFRKVYQTMIDESLESIMVGHIALPEMSRKLRPGIKDEEIMPATLAPELLNDLLRKEMGFNGLIITDATHMGGLVCMEKREFAIPKAIAAGCDMILFVSDPEEDIKYLKTGLESGILTEGRLNDAVLRILGLKAKLKLYDKKYLIPDQEIKTQVIGCEEHIKKAEAAADSCITLVKDTKKYLPINPAKQNRAYLVYISNTPNSLFYEEDKVRGLVKEELEKVGFIVDLAPNFYELEHQNGQGFHNKLKMMHIGKREEFIQKYDVVFFVINIKAYAQENNVRIRYSCSHSNEMPWFLTEVPTIGISLNYTTHLIDVPQLHTFVNSYGCTPTIISKTIEKICGRSEFFGKASETVFCGKWDTRL